MADFGENKNIEHKEDALRVETVAKTEAIDQGDAEIGWQSLFDHKITTFGNDKLDPKPEEQTKFYYTIAAPKSFRPNSDFVVKLSLCKGTIEWENTEPIVVSVAIEDDQDENAFRNERTATMQMNYTECISIPVGNVPLDASYKLVVKGVQGAKFEHEASLDVQTKKVSIMIQTDKGIYKPGDAVKFRVFVLNENLRPAAIDNDQLKIHVNDSSQNRIKQWKGINTANGVFADEFQLSDLPNLGKWTINVEVGNENKSTVIEVDEYVLPKFEVTIEASAHFSLKDDSIRAIIRAKYTHGNPVRGMATVSIAEEDQFGCFYFSKKSKQMESSSTKTVDVDGRGTVEFGIGELKLDVSKWEYYSEKRFTLKAEMIEELTGCTQSAKPISVVLHKERFKIFTNLIHGELKADSKITAKISVRNQDDSNIVVNESNNKISISRKNFTETIDDKGIDVECEFELDENGDAYYIIETKKETRLSLTANFLDQVQDIGTFYIEKEAKQSLFQPALTNLDVKVVTEKCRINEPIVIEVASPRQLGLYTYILMARAKIVEAKTINLPADAGNSYRFTFVPTFACAPQVDVIVYYVEEKSLCSSRTTIDLRDDLDNFIELNVDPDTAKPGDVVEISVESNSKTFVGLVGVDQSVLLLKEGNDLVRDKIWNELEQFHNQLAFASLGFIDPNKTKKKKYLPLYYNHFPDFSSSGLILFTNVKEPVLVQTMYKCKRFQCDMPMAFGGSPAPGQALFCTEANLLPLAAPKIRKEFPETWLWDSISGDKFNGKATIRKQVPDTITSWIITGFAIDAEHGLGITRTPTKLRVHQPFFVSLNLPYSVKRGEVVSVPCTVFNYLQQQVDVEVTLENEHNEFEFTSDTSIVDETAFSRKKKVSIMSFDGATVNFAIRPTKVGLISLKVVATSPIAGDAIVKTLNVESEGVTQFVNKAVFIDLRDKQQIDAVKVIVDIPKDALPDSSRIEISCVGDLLGGTIKNLQNLIRLPCGCGEQNMLNFVPNIVVLNYLTNTHQLTAEVEAKAKRFMEIGYQRELTYKHSDGSYSAFGQSDKSGSTWLTAFVARSFRQASTHITIEETTIAKALDWLSKTQAEDGSFQEKGSICHKEMQGGSSNGVALTAYVLCAFLENRTKCTQYEASIEKALKNVVDALHLASSMDTYALGVAAYALHLANHEAKSNVLNNLLNAAKTSDTFKWWDKNVDIGDSGFRESKMLNVEITAYGLLTLLLANEDIKCMPILKWLLNQRNSEGGFEGTQDTIIGIDALARLAAKIASKDSDVSIDLKASSANGNADHKFTVNADNGLVRQSQTLRPDIENVSISASGRGFALVEVSYKYNIKCAETDPSFLLKPVSKLLNAGNMTLTVDASFQAPTNSPSLRSNMAVLEVALPSGFVVDVQALQALKTTIETIKKVESKNDDTLAIIYFDHLSTDPISLKINGFRNHLVSEQKPVPIIVYDYYDNALSAREFYLPQGMSAEELTAA